MAWHIWSNFGFLAPSRSSSPADRCFSAVRRQQVVLATLLVSHPYPVSSDRLIDAVWGDDPPPTAPATLQAYVSRLRKLLAPQASGCSQAPEATDSRSTMRRSMPAVSIGPSTMRWRCSQDQRNAEIIDLLEPALGLWRSAVCIRSVARCRLGRGIPAPGWRERRLVAEELLADAYLALGRHLAGAIRLEGALAQWPLSESLAKRYMLALYRRWTPGRRACGIRANSPRTQARARPRSRRQSYASYITPSSIKVPRWTGSQHQLGNWYASCRHATRCSLGATRWCAPSAASFPPTES